MEEPRTLIKDIEELREFIKMNKRKQDYFNHIVQKARKTSIRKITTPNTKRIRIKTSSVKKAKPQRVKTKQTVRRVKRKQALRKTRKRR